MNFAQHIAEELHIAQAQVTATMALLDEGASVPFIARYRKEVTGGLDDTQLRQLEERLRYLRELDERRQSILEIIETQGKLDDTLRSAIMAADSKSRLEDLYLPYKQKRRTKAQIAREAGLEPLADQLLSNPELNPTVEAEKYLNEEAGVTDSKAALDGAKQILMERFAEDADLLGSLRHQLKTQGMLNSRVLTGKESEGTKFRDYFEYDEAIAKIPSHRALAMLRGRNEGYLTLAIAFPEGEGAATNPGEARVSRHWEIADRERPADKWLGEVVRWCWRVKLLPHLESDLLAELREHAESEAIQVFANNLKDLLMAAPAGPKATIGLDPGLRTGVKMAVLDATGKVVDHDTIYPTAPHNRTAEASRVLLNACKKYRIELIAIGNGTASRETDRFVTEVIRQHPQLGIRSIVVNEAGASIYSASEFAAREFPDLDVTIRGAVSIARRLQDPLAELVKIEPKSIGVGQYQHDVSQLALARQLDQVVEDCVNAVGVDANTASSPLLARVSGVSRLVAENIVAHRDRNGPFRSRSELLGVKRLGEKCFEQAAGFMRIREGDNPLDASAVHPESYCVVEQIAEKNGRQPADLLGASSFLSRLKPADYINEAFGIPTVTDILKELDKPGRDPRPEFRAAQFKEGIETLRDLRPDMILEGTVTNVTNFGAFVDVGVHQDGLVHISQIANRFVKDPREVVKAGDIVKVKVLDVDIARKRISMTMRLDQNASDTQAEGAHRPAQSRRENTRTRKNQKSESPQMGTLGQLLQQAQEKAG